MTKLRKMAGAAAAIADRIINEDEFEFRIGLPIQRHVKVARKDLPFRAVIEFDKVTFGM